VLRFITILLVLAAVMSAPRPAPLEAQQRRSPADDVIESMKRAVNDLRYDEAIRLGRDLEVLVPQMRASQVVAFRQVFALAWYPEENEFQRADSALRQLAGLVRVKPDAQLAQELSWSGLDSLLTVARDRTFGFAASPAAEYVLTGPDATGEIELLTTRPANVRLALVHRGSGRSIPQDSGLVRDRGRLRLRAHDGRAPLLDTGEYDLRIVAVAVDARARDTIVVVRRATVSAAAFTPQATPVLDSASLRPERIAPDRKRTVITGLLAGAATALIGSAVRGGGTLPDTYASDSRAGGVGVLIAFGSIGIAALEKGREIPEAIKANDLVRASHATRVAAVREENARRLAAHKVTVRFPVEDR